MKNLIRTCQGNFDDIYTILHTFHGISDSVRILIPANHAPAIQVDCIRRGILFTILMPTLTIFLFRKINGFTPEDLTERKRRYVPFILTITSYVFCLLMMHRLNIPWYMTGIICASLIVMIICVIVNLKWKLSEHMAGAGAIIGGLVAFSALFGYNPVGWLCIFILVAGVLGTARIILQHHTLGEVMGGFAVGLICTLLVLHPLSKLLFRLFSIFLF